MLVSALLPLATIMAVSTFHFAANRYVFVSLVSWIVLASMGLVQLANSTDRIRRTMAIGLLVAILAVSLSENLLYFTYQNGNRDDWGAAFDRISQDKLPGDLVVAPDTRIADYYLGEGTTSMRTFDPEAAVSNGKRIWIIEDINVQPKYPEVYEWVSEHAELVENFDVHVRARNFIMRVYLWEP